MSTIPVTGGRHSMKLFLAAFATCILVVAGLPITLAFAHTVVTRSILGSILGVAIALGVIATYRIARRQGVNLTRSILLFCFFVSWTLATFSGWLRTRTVSPSTCRVVGGNRTICTGADIIHTHPAAWVLLGLAILILFGSLVFAPSHETELSRRIDLESCAIALPFSLFFFLTYGQFDDAGLPHFSTTIAMATLLLSYLLGRLALTIKYR
jgi:hypothetical protein